MKRNKHFGSVPIRCVKGMVLSIIVFLPVLLCGFTEIHTLENTRGGEKMCIRDSSCPLRRPPGEKRASFGKSHCFLRKGAQR